MKKIIFLCAIALLFFATTSCKREDGENMLKDKAIVVYTGEPALDGCGYFLKIGNIEYKPLSQLPSFCKNGMTVLVNYKVVKNKWKCNWRPKEYRQIKIFNISKK